MRSQGCLGCLKFRNCVLKTNSFVWSANIQLKLSKLTKYGQKQWFFRSFFAFFAFFKPWSEAERFTNVERLTTPITRLL